MLPLQSSGLPEKLASLISVTLSLGYLGTTLQETRGHNLNIKYSEKWHDYLTIGFKEFKNSSGFHNHFGQDGCLRRLQHKLNLPRSCAWVADFSLKISALQLPSQPLSTNRVNRVNPKFIDNQVIIIIIKTNFDTFFSHTYFYLLSCLVFSL